MNYKERIGQRGSFLRYMVPFIRKAMLTGYICQGQWEVES